MAKEKLSWLNVALKNSSKEQDEIKNEVYHRILRTLNLKYDECWQTLRDESPENTIDAIINKIDFDLSQLKNSYDIQEKNSRFLELNQINQNINENITKTQEEILISLESTDKFDSILLENLLKPACVKALTWLVQESLLNEWDIWMHEISLWHLVKLCTKYISWDEELLKYKWIWSTSIETIKKIFAEYNINI